MLDKKGFWVVQNLFLLLFWIAALALYFSGQPHHWLVMVAVVVFVAHVLELPLAMMALRGRKPAPLRLLIMTLLFGYTWWLPARRGVYTAS